MTDAVPSPPPMIMIVRHAEKPHGGKPHGITPDGNHDIESLTVAGWIRAGALTELFASVTREPQDELRTPDRIYAASYRRGQSKRSVQTVAPLADRLAIHVNTDYHEGDETHLAKEIRELSGATLVSWHHETIYKIVKHLGDVAPDAPKKWPNSRFDVVWTFTRTADGWAFAQVPQLLRPDDTSDPITDGHAEDEDEDDLDGTAEEAAQAEESDVPEEPAASS